MKMSINSSLIEIRNLSVDLNGNKVIDGLNLAFPSATFIAIVGHNGSGKTTFLNAFAGDIPSEGIFLLTGNKVSDFSENTSFLHQNNELSFDISVKELVVMGLFSKKKLLENYTQEDYKQVERVLKELGIETLLDRNFQNLSGGEKQLVWVAQILLQNREIVFFDEPTRALDPKNKSLLFKIMRGLISKGKTVFCITHDLDFLNDMQGILVNFSKNKPVVEEISSQVIKENYAFLRQL